MLSIDPSRFREYPLDVDIEAGQFGMLTLPTGIQRKTGFIIINSGLLHRVGPYRLYVHMARKLACHGFASIRLDQSGRGDSDSRSTESIDEAIVVDIGTAFDKLQSEANVESLVLGGLCSGADDAFAIATRQKNIKGIFLLDGWAPRNLKYYLFRYGPKLLSKTAWMNRLSKTGRVREEMDGADERNWRTSSEMSEQFRNILAQNIKTLAIYTSSADDIYSYCRQTSAALGIKKGSPMQRFLTEIYESEATHLYPMTSHREKMLEMLVSWASENFV